MKRPDHQALADVAAGQGGLFSRKQAHAFAVSDAALSHHTRTGRYVRVRRGVYQLRGAPIDEQEELVALWLATDQRSVFVDDTALVLHGLSDAMPARIHMALPPPRARRRLGERVVVHTRDIPAGDRTWVDKVPVTTVRRTLADCARGQVAQDLVRQAAEEAMRRGLLEPDEVRAVADELAGRS